MAVLPALTPLKLGHGLAYVTAVVLRLRRHGRRVRDAYSSTDRLTLSWLRNLTVGAVALVAVSLLAYALDAPGSPPTIGMDPTAATDDLTLLAVTLFVYSIGYIGLRQPEIFAPVPSTMPAAPDVRPARYARSGMDAATSSLIEERLATVMDRDKPFRRGDLTLDDLAGVLGVSPHNLTEVINTRLGQNFYDFVNGHRVRDVQARLAEPDADRYTLLAIAMDAGFNSKSAFNAAFKRQTGMTPSEYRSMTSTQAV
jgi:AraC-like DNA-binding protein